MTEIVINKFGGLIPRLGTQKLGDYNASIAKNCLLTSGDLEGLNRPERVDRFESFSGTVRRVFRVEKEGELDILVPFEDDLTHFVKGPLVNDAYDRVYYTQSTTYPTYNTYDRIALGNDGYKLGVPKPATAPSVSPSGGSGLDVTRAYVYTFVSAYGEEGPPSDPTVATGKDDGTWNIGNMDTNPADESLRNITHKNIYRTVTGISGAADYHFVAQVALASSATADAEATDDVALNDICDSFSFYPPPDDLQGLVAHPNGFLVGYTGRDIYFSEAYRPHAWPPEYVLSVENLIVGLGVFGTMVAVLTTDKPYSATGIAPASMSLTKIDKPEPCVSHQGIVSTIHGVYYPSPNGLMLWNQAGIINATYGLMTKDEWNKYDIANIDASAYDKMYVAFYSQTDGFIFSPDEPLGMFVELDEFWQVQSVQNEVFPGKIHIVYDNSVWEWNPPGGVPLVYTWRSKEIVVPKPINWGAYRCDWSGAIELSEETIDIYESYNAERFAAGPLDPLNFNALNNVRKYPLNSTLPQNKTGVNGSPLYDIGHIREASGYVRLRIYANNELVYDYQLPDQCWHLRLPAGYKCDHFQFELLGTGRVEHLKVAETGKGLLNV